ncbi:MULTISPECIES: M3 family oligoendopeptidase [Alteribacter]|uniref:M3 family oligoendopeptidase n=1 Tax=Alteribacter keqinensis TaxID=2483800 RepID=A0A3M7TR29_9BACI|nr:MULTISPECIES: M3 family oligoendopeptidase [Alteribacter]MBM7095518.1 M3 family oligoendopeptidase [Alteribacter salitolerans]RNA67881.1 M3 family oligoendopeptidase [Alteribacter keqinensis]
MKQMSQVWDLETIFPGGSESDKFQSFLSTLEEDISQFQKDLSNRSVPETEEELFGIVHVLVRAQEISKRVRESGAFVSCLTAQNTKDEPAKLLTGRVKQLSSSYSSFMTSLDELLLGLSDDLWESLVNLDEVKPLTYNLEERRRLANDKLPAEKEKLMQSLSVDGYHAWGDMYNTIVGRMSVEVEEDGETKSLSVGQAANKMTSKDRNTRQHVAEQWEKAWGDEAELFANTLNHLGGFRLQTYEARGWDHVLKEPMDINRMQQKTLDVMWKTIEDNKPVFTKYLKRKAELLGLEKLDWTDVGAPLTSEVEEVSYDDAANMIVQQFESFSPKMAQFAEKAFSKRWIEAESRPGKRPGGFCTSFPVKEQSRIFMTYDGSASNVATLAHELGHAYHQHVMNDLPQMAQRYAMNVAETASTFAEMIVADATVKQAATEEAKVQLLDDKLNRAIAFFMNIHSRFLFETKFYEERKKGLVSVHRLNELMLEAQKEAYCDELGSYSPHFWASKLHFHITGVPFYNFPYTFGYLFSMGIYAKAEEEGTAFEERYIELLRDTGRMQVEDLAQKHLDADLTKPEFWQSAIDLVAKDVETFIDLTEK